MHDYYTNHFCLKHSRLLCKLLTLPVDTTMFVNIWCHMQDTKFKLATGAGSVNGIQEQCNITRAKKIAGHVEYTS